MSINGLEGSCCMMVILLASTWVLESAAKRRHVNRCREDCARIDAGAPIWWR